MTIKDMVIIHNLNFEKKVDEKYFKISNIYRIYEIKNVAYLILIDSIDVYEIFEIAVHPSFKRKGYASCLIKQIPSDKEVFLEVNENNFIALGLYYKNGFEIVSKRKKYYKNDSAIIMKKVVNKKTCLKL